MKKYTLQNTSLRPLKFQHSVKQEKLRLTRGQIRVFPGKTVEVSEEVYSAIKDIKLFKAVVEKGDIKVKVLEFETEAEKAAKTKAEKAAKTKAEKAAKTKAETEAKTKAEKANENLLG